MNMRVDSDPIICYPLAPKSSKWKNDELRHSLRSIEKYWKGIPDVGGAVASRHNATAASHPSQEIRIFQTRPKNSRF